jgi:hypothetical protein
MGLPAYVQVQDPPSYDDPPPQTMRAPVPWRVSRLLMAFFLVMIGGAMVFTTLALIYWPAVIILVGVLMVICGAFFIRIEPTPPKQQR